MNLSNAAISLQVDNLSTSLVAPLAYFDRGSIVFAGGKGANLGQLIKEGLSVPAGFMSTTATYDLLIKRPTQASIQEVFGFLEINDPACEG